MTDARPSAAVIEQAARWAAQLATDEATQADRDACEAWCGLDSSHLVAMERMRSLDARIDDTNDAGRETLGLMLARRSRKGRSIGGLALGIVVFGIGGWLASQSLTVRGLFPDVATRIGEQRAVPMADGSTVMLDTDAAIDVAFDPDQRHVTLFRGQVLARVAADAARPFVVETRDGAATALGTSFVVRRDVDATTVTVVASVVRACLAQRRQTCADLRPGDRVRMSGAELRHLKRVEPDAAAIWAEGWLAADDRPVAEVLDELDRYLATPVRFDPVALAGIRVSGSFPLDEPDRALAGIARSTGLRLSHAADGTPVLSRGR